MKGHFGLLNSKNTNRKKDRIFIKNNLNNFIYSIQQVLNEIITSNKDNITNILANKSLIYKDQLETTDLKAEYAQN
jgi:hypothetical protein